MRKTHRTSSSALINTHTLDILLPGAGMWRNSDQLSDCGIKLGRNEECCQNIISIYPSLTNGASASLDGQTKKNLEFWGPPHAINGNFILAFILVKP